jgi:hypothetical protein
MKLTIRTSLVNGAIWLMPAIVSAAGGSPSTGLGGATNLHGLDDYNGCMAQTAGAQEKLTAQVLQRKLDSSSSLAALDRQRLQEDIEWLNAKAANPRAPAPDPKNPQRYLLAMTDQEQMEVSGAYGRFANEVHDKCEAQYGGMSQFSDPAGRRHAAIDTRVAFPDLLHAAPPVSQPTAAEQHKNCMASLGGLRWQLMAEHMEQKLGAMPNLSAQERKAWDEDIAVVRAAAQSNARTMPQSPDPNNPMRYMTRLTPQDQMAMIQEQSARSQQLLAGCSGSSPASAGGGQVSAQRSQELAAMHERRRAGNDASRTLDPGAANAEAQAWLAARPFKPRAYAAGSATQADYLDKSGALACYDRQKGFRAHQTAQRLMTKRTTAAPQDRQELEAWITAWGAAEQAGKDEPAPISPTNQQGWLRFLSGPDQQEMNMANSALHDMIRRECSSMDYMEVGTKDQKTK